MQEAGWGQCTVLFAQAVAAERLRQFGQGLPSTKLDQVRLTKFGLEKGPGWFAGALLGSNPLRLTHPMLGWADTGQALSANAPACPQATRNEPSASQLAQYTKSLATLTPDLTLART
jgi:hypothetical protein